MEILFAILAGGIRGLTELLPLSFSAHRGLYHAITMRLSGQELQEPIFSLLLHLSLLVAILLFFWRELLIFFRTAPESLKRFWAKKETEKTAFYKQLFLFPFLVILPLAGAILIPADFCVSNLPLITALLLLTGGILCTIDRLPEHSQSFTPEKALIIGGARLLSYLPGLSPLGNTLFAGQALGQMRKKSLLVAFLLAVPELLVAVIRDIITICQTGAVGANTGFFAWILGALACGAAAFYSIRLMNWLLSNRKVSWLAYYVWFLAGFVFMIWFRG